MIDLTNGGTSAGHAPKSIIGEVFYIPRYNLFMRVIADNEDDTLEVSIPCRFLADTYSVTMTNIVSKKYFVQNAQVPVLDINCEITNLVGDDYVVVMNPMCNIDVTQGSMMGNYLNEREKSIGMFDLS